MKFIEKKIPALSIKKISAKNNKSIIKKFFFKTLKQVEQKTKVSLRTKQKLKKKKRSFGVITHVEYTSHKNKNIVSIYEFEKNKLFFVLTPQKLKKNGFVELGPRVSLQSQSCEILAIMPGVSYKDVLAFKRLKVAKLLVSGDFVILGEILKNLLYNSFREKYFNVKKTARSRILFIVKNWNKPKILKKEITDFWQNCSYFTRFRYLLLILRLVTGLSFCNFLELFCYSVVFPISRVIGVYGETIVEFQDGTRVSQFRNGTSFWRMATGEFVTRRPDGSEEIVFYNHPIGFRRRLVRLANGIQQLHDPNGGIRTRTASGHVIVEQYPEPNRNRDGVPVDYRGLPINKTNPFDLGRLFLRETWLETALTSEYSLEDRPTKRRKKFRK